MKRSDAGRIRVKKYLICFTSGCSVNVELFLGHVQENENLQLICQLTFGVFALILCLENHFVSFN